MAQWLEMPLTRVPDPFGSPHGSFGHANNARLRAFLDRFGFAYEFASATDYYTSGRFDEMLLRMLEVYDAVMEIILPTLGPDRKATYSPFLPVCPRTGKVLQVPMVERHPQKGTIVYVDPQTGEKVETKVTGGAVKCQWKADWALRWASLGVDYEMAGKDLIELGHAVIADLQGAWQAAARRLQLRTLPGRERPEDLEVEGQRPDHRRLARLCADPVARPVHVPEA